MPFARRLVDEEDEKYGGMFPCGDNDTTVDQLSDTGDETEFEWGDEDEQGQYGGVPLPVIDDVEIDPLSRDL